VGRKPKPTKLKLLTGNPGKRALNKHEPQPSETMPDCPPHLDEEARAEWNRLAPELNASGVLTVVDRGILATYCQCWSRWVRAEQMVQEHGECLVSPKSLQLYQSPWLGIANRALDELRAIGGELGLSPVARTRISVAPKTESDPMEELLNSRPA
jgi:P27 family predicted phage terminase small subunit